MADYYLQFSFEITHVSAEELYWLESHYAPEPEADDEEYRDNRLFQIDIYTSREDFRSTVCISAEESGEPEDVVAFLTPFLREFRPDTKLSFSWAHTCSKMRPGDFGGGAVQFTKDSELWMSTDQWMRDDHALPPATA